jgi:hypothetical protein
MTVSKQCSQSVAITWAKNIQKYSFFSLYDLVNLQLGSLTISSVLYISSDPDTTLISLKVIDIRQRCTECPQER